jgi:hypothetical protein
MATQTYMPLGTTIVSASASSVTFSGFSGYRDYVLVAKSKNFEGPRDQGIQFNGDNNGSNYSSVFIWGNGSTGGSSTSTWLLDFYGSVTTDNTTSTVVEILGAGTSGIDTSWLSRSNRIASGVDIIAGRWNNSAPVTSITYFIIGGTIAPGSSVSLYGIAS